MDEDEAKLLAELKAISSGSDRFQSEEPIADTAVRSSLVDRHSPAKQQQQLHQEPISEEPRRSPAIVLPWKKKKEPPKSEKVTTPPQQNAPPSTFQGERGGAAEDPELLALLRGVSAKSSASRFDGDENVETVADPKDVEPEPEQPPKKERPLPPWKQQRKAPKEPELEIVVADPATKPTATNNNTVEKPTYGIKSNVASTFQGERGGAAEDAELLALLQGVSEKAGASRFDGNENDADDGPAAETPPRDTKPVGNNAKPSRPLPAWKPKKAPEGADASTVAEKSVKFEIAETNEAVRHRPAGFKRSTTSTFKGERGGQAEDAELLALLRGVSEKAGASRFDDEGASSNEVTVGAMETPADESSAPKRPLPPWKQKRPTPPSNTDVVVNDGDANEISEEAPLQPSYGIKSEIQSTFTGERGGAAEDAELLALLRGVSTTAASSRFDDGEGTAACSAPAHPAPAQPPEKQNTVPPWKRNRTPKQRSEPSVLIAGSKNEGATTMPGGVVPNCVEENGESSNNTAKDEPPTYGIKSTVPSTFQGERGGSAEDPELLALLRGVSTKSNSRFDDSGPPSEETAGDQTSNENHNRPLPPWKQKSPTDSSTKLVLEHRSSPSVSPKNSPSVPPWKRNRSAPKPIKATNALNEPQTSAVTEDLQPTYGIKSSIASNFKGERGGSAEDEELLALLRGVSAKSASSRFDETAEPMAPENTHATSESPEQPSSAHKSNVEKVESRPQEIQPNYGIKPEFTSTFQGDRGGAAEDAELLALLRGVSSQASAGRFSNEEVNPDSHPSPGGTSDPADVYSPPKTRSTATTNMMSPAAGQPQATEAPLVSLDTLPQSLVDKNWKVRAQSYELLETLLKKKSPSSDGLVNAGDILPALDESVLAFAVESSAPALDKALSFLNLYADKCRLAGSADQAGKLVSSLLKKNALSGRPSTLRLASALVLKLMEVSLDGAASVHSTVQVLVSEGFTSKKPKLVQTAVSLVLESALHFGACSLPLASIVSGIPKVLSNANATVRKNGLMIVAELCRALGSKDPIQGLFDGMKPAQVVEVDAMLESQPKSAPIKTGLRNSKKGSKGSVADSLAVLQAGSEAMKAQQFAARPAVDVIGKVKKSEYASLLVMPKWSQKVAALEIVLECGGEKPYKLAQPSNSTNYAPLISDMKGLFGHTHFAVVSKAVLVLAMFASGVGEKLFPHLRPLLGPLLRLSKDKKLTRAVNECLDSLFGNVLSLDQLFDGDDTLWDAVSEKKQKNELVRKTAVEFLSRCVERRGSAGSKGALSVHNAALAAKLGCERLSDPDATVRKGAMAVLSVLQNVDDRKIVVKVHSAIDALQSSNPRAYKNLTKGVKTQPSKPSSNKSPEKKSDPVPPASQGPRTKRVALPTEATSRSVASPSGEAASDAQPDAALAKGSVPTQDIPHLEDALIHVTSLTIPNWSESLDDGGILEGLKCKFVIDIIAFVGG